MNEKLKSKYLELYQKFGEIRIRCQGASTLPIDAIFDFQGGLKRLSQENAIRLATSLFVNGFCAPFFIWERDSDAMCLDGHGRLNVLCGLREAGIPIPSMLPVAYIMADNESEARQKLLAITSQYGEFEIAQLDDWLKNIDADIRDSLRIVDNEMKLSVGVVAEESEKKTSAKEPCICPACGYEF
jgi:hypothetical protein